MGKKNLPKEAKQQPQEPKIQFAPLMECPVCGWEPPPQSVGETPDFNKTWIIMQTPLPGIWFFICPECHGVATNPNAADNLELLVELQNRKIFTADDMDRIAIPRLNLGRL